MLINLKPLGERRLHASDVIRRLQPELAKIPGITLYMQPIQDLTVEDRVSRTQYQYTLEAADAKLLSEWVPRLVERLSQVTQLTDVASDLQDQGLQAYVDIDRDSAGRLGITPAVQTEFQGAAASCRESLGATLLLVLAAVVTMYIVLGVLYESYIHPVTILSTLPTATVGALAALLVGRQELGIVAVIGIILLIGIVKKNAIMMIDFALDAERLEEKSPRDAIRQACLLRFRPILMTTFAALFGALPLMLGGGVGSELRHPLGLTMVGGLIVSQVLTLFTTPVIYLYFDRMARRYRREALA